MARNPARSGRDGGDNPPPASHQGASSNKHPHIKNPILWINILTLLVVSVYTYYAREQVKETQKANAIANKSLTEVNKPYVVFNNIYPNYTNDKTESILGWA